MKNNENLSEFPINWFNFKYENCATLTTSLFIKSRGHLWPEIKEGRKRRAGGKFKNSLHQVNASRWKVKGYQCKTGKKFKPHVCWLTTIDCPEVPRLHLLSSNLQALMNGLRWFEMPWDLGGGISNNDQPCMRSYHLKFSLCPFHHKDEPPPTALFPLSSVPSL